MSTINNQTVENECAEILKQEYSIDASKIRNIKENTNELYYINFIMLIIYYSLFAILFYLIFKNIFNSPQVVLKSSFLLFLFLYPIIIYPIQYNVYHTLKYFFNHLYKNVYFSKDW